MSDDDLNSLADKLCERIELKRRAFWIEPESHYTDHIAIRELIQDCKMAKGIFWKAFIGLAVVGSIVLAALGMAGWHK